MGFNSGFKGLMACTEVVLKVHINVERNKYSIMFMSREHKAGQN